MRKASELHFLKERIPNLVAEMTLQPSAEPFHIEAMNMVIHALAKD